MGSYQKVNRHENKPCPKEYKCKSKECSFRHPKACKHFFREGICRFGEDCSYRHKNDFNIDLNVEDIKEQHANEIKTLKDEMSKIKEIMVLMQNQITALNDEIQSSKKINISEIVVLVVSLLDNPKASEISSTTTNKTQGQINCDICDFESKNENIMMSHMIDHNFL